MIKALARSVDGYGSILYFKGKEGIARLTPGKSKKRINMTVAILINASVRTDTRIDKDVFTKKRKKMKRSNPVTITRADTTGSAKETMIIARNKYNGKKKRDKAVMSASKLAIRKLLGITYEVKIKLCSYSNTTYPLRAEMRLMAITPEITVERESM